MSPNRNPEQVARDAIDAQLRFAGWAVQLKDSIDFHPGEGQAVREYSTDSGPADYVPPKVSRSMPTHSSYLTA